MTAPRSATGVAAASGVTDGHGSRRWVRIPAVTAPVAMIGGWTVAAAVQPVGYSSARSSISDLAALYARHREIMTGALVVVGTCLVLVAAGLRTVRRAGRAALAISGVGVLVVAAAPLPVGWRWHGDAALVAFAGLSWWPVLGMRRGITPYVDPARAVPVTVLGTLVLASLYFAPGAVGGYGAAERVLAAGGLLWLCAVVFACTGETAR